MLNDTVFLKVMRHRVCHTALAATLAFVTCAVAEAGVMLSFGANSFSSNNPHTGASGTVSLTFAAVGGNVRVTAFVTNTTGQVTFGAGATKSSLTGFGFDLAPGVTYVANSFIGGLKLDTLIVNAAAQPFGSLDIAGADNNNFNGGNANNAITEGNSDTFSVLLAGMTAANMEAAFQNGFAYVTSINSVMRFQQVNAGAGSDKLQYNDPGPGTGPVPSVPEPGSFAILFGLVGSLIPAWRQRRQPV